MRVRYPLDRQGGGQGVLNCARRRGAVCPQNHGMAPASGRALWIRTGRPHHSRATAAPVRRHARMVRHWWSRRSGWVGVGWQWSVPKNRFLIVWIGGGRAGRSCTASSHT